MRRSLPLIIILIGLAAFAVDFLPNLKIPTFADPSSGAATSRKLDTKLGLDLAGGEFHDAILTLRDAGYVEGDLSYAGGPTAHFAGLYVTGRGLQALGEWPLFDEIASPDTLALLLERFAEEAPIGDAANLRRAAQYARRLGAASLRSAAVGALAHVARIGLGLG